MNSTLLACLLGVALTSSANAQAAPAKSAAPKNASSAVAPAAAAPVPPAAPDATRAQIEYWLTKYDASELRIGVHRCPAPRFPAVSKQNDEITAVNARMGDWRDCYNAFANYVNALPPAEQRIPAEVRARMTKEELEQAKAHIVEAQAFVVDSATVNSKLVLADFDAWRNATEAYVKEHNIIIQAAQANDRGEEGEARRNNYAPKSK